MVERRRSRVLWPSLAGERDEREEQALAEVVRSGIWWRGAMPTRRICRWAASRMAFARFHDAKYCIAVTNGYLGGNRVRAQSSGH